jgi:hypothetical protein
MAVYGELQKGAATQAQAEASARLYEYNAAVARQNAEVARQAAAQEEGEYRKRTRALMGSQIAQFGRAGVTMEGTPLEVLGETAAEAELNAQRLRYRGELEAWKYLSSANISSAQAAQEMAYGEYAGRAGMLGAGTTLLTGMTKAMTSAAEGYEKLWKFRKEGAGTSVMS